MAFKGLRFVALEWRNILASKVMWVVVAAIGIMPLLYGALYLAAFQDPYERLNTVPVAVVNEDAGAIIDGSRQNIGDDVIDRLVDTEDGLQWNFVSRAEAEQGLEDGSYFMTCVIPVDFSERIASVEGDDPLPAELLVTYNESANMLASQIGESVWKEVRLRVSTSIAEEYWQTMFERISDSGEDMQTAADGASDLQEGLESAHDGSQTITDKLGSLANGSQELEDGLEALQGGVESLDSGLGNLSDGASTLKGGMQDLSAGLGEVVERTQDLPDQTAALSQGLSSLASSLQESLGDDEDAQTLIGGSNQVAQGLEALDAGASTLQESTHALSAGAGDLSQSLSQIAAQVKGLSQLDPTNQSLAALSVALDQASGGASQLSDGLSQMDSSMDALTASTGQLSAGARSLHEGLSSMGSALSDPQGGLSQLMAGMSELASQSGALTSALDEAADGSAKLTEGAGSLVDGAATARDGSGKLLEGARIAHDGAGAVASGAQQLRDGSAELADGLLEAEDGSAELADGLAEGVQSIREQTANSDGKSLVMSDPVQLRNEYYTSVKNYGTGFAPYFMALGLWVGCLVAGFVFRPLNKRLIMSGANPVTVAFVNYAPMALFALVQASLLMLVLQFGLKLQIDNVPAFYGMGYLTALAFAAIMQMLTAAFEFPGKFVAIILLMLQLTACAGTFPIQTTPEFFQAINPFLPMTYVVEGMRQVMTGLNGQLVLFDCGVLLAIGVASFALTCLVAWMKRTVRMEDLHPLLHLG